MDNLDIIEKEYPVSLSNKILTGIAAAVLFGFAVFFFTQPFAKLNIAKWIVTPVFVAIAVFIVLNMFRKLTITKDSILYRGRLSTQQIPFAAIKGYRFFQGQMVLEPLTTAYSPMVIIYSDHKHADELQLWVQKRFKDLNAADLQAARDQLLQDESLGASEQERKYIHKQAKKIAVIYNVLGITAAFVYLFFKDAFSSVVLLLIPLIGIALLYTNKGFIKFYSDSSRSINAQIYPGILFSSVFVFVHSLKNYQVLQEQQLFIPALVIGGIIMLLLYKRGINRAAGLVKAQVILMLMAALFYGVACTREINCRFDNSAVKIYTTKVVRSYVSKKRSSQSFRFVLDTIAAKTSTTNIVVSHQLYSRFAVGDTLPVFVKQGSLQIQWYWLE